MDTAITTTPATPSGDALAIPPSVPTDLRAGSVARQEFGASQLQVLGETAVTASAATARAEIEAAYVMAMQRPRNMDLVFERLMRDCKRPGFAATALYKLRRGGKDISGPSIRFVEAALRAMGNVMTRAQVLYDDPDKQLILVVGVDLESNTRFDDTVIVEKVVERREIKEGQKVLGSRRNSYGEMVYQVPATEDDLRMKRGAEVSRAIRNIGLRLIPGDMVDDAKTQIRKTAMDRASKDPDGERKALIMAFSDLGVSGDQLGEYLGHNLSGVQPAELVELREVWKAISDGQTTWREVMAEKSAEVAREAVKAEPSTAKKSTADRLKGKVEAATALKSERQPGDDSDELGLK